MFGPGMSVGAVTIPATYVLGGTMSQPYYPPPPLPPVGPTRWGRFALWTAAAAVAAFAVGGGLGVALQHDRASASPALCKSALAENYREAMAAGPEAPSAAAPSACVGLDEATLRRLAGEVVSEYLGSAEGAEGMRRRFEEGMASAAGRP